ncbi:hypothetical protein SARC_00413 [Sphaeroforma arctica JP610]|uniref:Uncharacterized protein n=1 Tax=Sphaeroforma arctica JP610 TaxID=667725 RepID=A0A0L0GGM1_9EUKA|nr:hypothetical protein SARC_00413 [Sphaeroforma arctica JP610]KNC87478.1 hypothetical protein SARC_00413 [Sphaeroforma arctica JP610]|eukprot:XP_014161380.1 hypothetical protein SARC_00413 [Sphaeroforma arctica JP610]
MGTKVGHTTTANMDAEQMTMLDVSLNEDIETQEGQDTLVNDENVGPKENAISDLNTAQLKKPKLSGIQRHTIDIVEASAATICSSMPLVETQHMQIDTTRSIAAGSGPNGARATASDNNQDVAEPNPVVTTKPNPVVTTKPNPVLRQTQLRESTVVVKSRTSVVSRSEDMPWSGLPPPKIKPLATPQQQLTPGKQARSGIRPPNTIVQQTPTKVIVTSTSGPGTAVLAGYESNLASLILKCEKAVERTVVPPKKNEKNPLRWKVRVLLTVVYDVRVKMEGGCGQTSGMGVLESNVKFGIFIKELKGYLRQLTQHAEEFRDHCVTVEQRLILDRQGEKARLKPVRVRAEKAEKALHATQQLLDEAKQYTEDLRNRLDNHDSSTKEEVEKMREASTGYREAVASLQTELDQLRRTHSHTLHTHKQAQQQSQLQIDAYRDKIEELRDTIDKKAEEVRSLQADLSNMANTAGTEEREIKFRDTRIADMEASIRKTTAESEALKERLQEKEVEMSKTLETFSMAQTSYLSQVNAFTANQSKDEKLIDDLKQQLSEAKQQLHDTTNEARSNSDDLNAQIKQLAEGQQAKDVELAEAKLQNKKLEASVEELVIKSKLTELKIDESNTELEDLRSQNSRLKNELERLAHQLQVKYAAACLALILYTFCGIV